MRVSIFVLFGLLTVAACSGSASAPAAPTSTSNVTPTILAGTWTGSSTDTSGQANMTWILSPSGDTVTGTTSISSTARSMMGNGTMQGAFSGTTMTFQMTVPSGGFTGMMSSCSMGLNGQATLSSDGRTMTGTYSGSLSGMMSGGMMGQSCGGAMNNGQFTLTR